MLVAAFIKRRQCPRQRGNIGMKVGKLAFEPERDTLKRIPNGRANPVLTTELLGDQTGRAPDEVIALEPGLSAADRAVLRLDRPCRRGYKKPRKKNHGNQPIDIALHDSLLSYVTSLLLSRSHARLPDHDPSVVAHVPMSSAQSDEWLAINSRMSLMQAGSCMTWI